MVEKVPQVCKIGREMGKYWAVSKSEIHMGSRVVELGDRVDYKAREAFSRFIATSFIFPDQGSGLDGLLRMQQRIQAME